MMKGKPKNLAIGEIKNILLKVILCYCIGGGSCCLL